MNKFEFIRLNKSNFHSYKDLIESSELDYPEALRADVSDYEAMAFEVNSICIVLFVDGIYAGNIMASEPTLLDFNDIGEYLLDGKTIYIYNILITSLFQGKGLGLKLMSKLIEIAKNLDYKFINGNFRTNGSYKIAKKFNIIYEKKIENWEGSGEDFFYCVISL